MKSKSKSTYFNSNGKKRPENNSRKNRRNNEYFEYILPSDTRKLIEENIGSIDNYALKLNKASPFDYKDEKFKFFEKDKKDVLINIEPNFSGINFSALSDRYRDSPKRLGLEVKSGIYKIDWKLAIGLGNESVYETAIALHHIYGIPYISGSALKGVVRSYIILENFSKNKNGDIDLKNAEARALKDQGFCDLFGCPKESFYGESRQGKVIFFDAFPLSEPKIEPDIMNPHFDPYYSDNLNKTPPADYHDPKPIFFLVVKDTEYEFAVGIKEIHDTNIPIGVFKGKTPLSAVCYWMEKTLKEHGIGAKSSVGYGYFENI
ncbi:MAG: type III-B CRISPR module RAMP protein Cmr6 [Methanosarcina sp.]|nr:type III-B CRISPR module RAMP protein Cmr6 [Methanosarcina sp.]MDD4523259.1 type III-B CRISPR module RAMP protein Cmr6 [Methanosarcina sp.]